MYLQKWGKATISRLIKETSGYAKSVLQNERKDEYGLAANAIEQTIQITALAKIQNKHLATIKNLHTNLIQAIQQTEYFSDQSETCDHPRAQAIAQLGRRWFTPLSDDAKAWILRERVTLDPIEPHANLPMTLTHRLQANNITIRSYQHYQPSPLEFHLELVENQWLLPPEQAFAFLAQACNTTQRLILQKLLQDQRLQLVECSFGASDFCIASLEGCFIQLTVHQGRINLYDLLHEFGHCLHFGNQLDVWSVSSDLEQETAAVAFEIVCLKQLEESKATQAISQLPAFHATKASVSKLRTAYYGNWLWRIHQFELALYREQIDSPKQLDALWARIVSASQGNWRSHSHLYIAPFYTVLYPFTNTGLYKPNSSLTFH